jgi:hypothetical protein
LKGWKSKAAYLKTQSGLVYSQGLKLFSFIEPISN